MNSWRGIQLIIMVRNYLQDCVFSIFFNRVSCMIYSWLRSLGLTIRNPSPLNVLRVGNVGSRIAVGYFTRMR